MPKTSRMGLGDFESELSTASSYTVPTWSATPRLRSEKRYSFVPPYLKPLGSMEKSTMRSAGMKAGTPIQTFMTLASAGFGESPLNG
jgi:hypothetical protein